MKDACSKTHGQGLRTSKQEEPNQTNLIDEAKGDSGDYNDRVINNHSPTGWRWGSGGMEGGLMSEVTSLLKSVRAPKFKDKCKNDCRCGPVGL